MLQPPTISPVPMSGTTPGCGKTTRLPHLGQLDVVLFRPQILNDKHHHERPQDQRRQDDDKLPELGRDH